MTRRWRKGDSNSRSLLGSKRVMGPVSLTNTHVKPERLTPGKVQVQADCFISYPLYSTMSKITIFELGSKSGEGSISFFTNSSCLPVSPALLRNASVLLCGSPSKYICVTILSCRPLTWKWMCAVLIRLGPAGEAAGLIVLNRYRPSESVVRTAEPSKFGSSGAGLG